MSPPSVTGSGARVRRKASRTKTGRLLAQALGLAPDGYTVSFQSRFGKAKWLEPYTEPSLKALAQRGVARVDVVCPGFTSDCLETLEELDGENRHYFEDNGGERFAYIPCLNDSDLGMKVIETVVRRELQGWV